MIAVPAHSPKEPEPWEPVHFQVYKSQLVVVEQERHSAPGSFRPGCPGRALDHGRSEGVLKFHRDLAAFSDVINERWTKA